MEVFMTKISKPRYICDEEGNKIEVIISMADYETLLEALEDAHDIEFITERRNSNEETISWETLKTNLANRNCE
jgi:hypothetical protein